MPLPRLPGKAAASEPAAQYTPSPSSLNSANRSSFHSRDYAAQQVPVYHPSHPERSPYAVSIFCAREFIYCPRLLVLTWLSPLTPNLQNPNHYSARPETYHRKSFGPSDARKMSFSKPSHQAVSSEDDVGHGRGPTSAIDPSVEDNATDRSWQTTEETRLDEDARKERYWKRWGPYLSERQWVSTSIQSRALYHSFPCPWGQMRARAVI